MESKSKKIINSLLSLDFEEVVVYIPKNVETMPSKSLEYLMC